MAIVLIIKTVDDQIIELPILSKTTIGRSSSSDLKLEDKKVSAKHCSFEINSKGQLVMTDLGSTNGSYVNNSIVTKGIIKINDVISIGSTTIKIDATRLNAREKAALGTSPHSSKNKSLPALKKEPASLNPERNTIKKKISLLLEKSSATNTGAKSKLQADQDDESNPTGQTRVITRDSAKIKK